MIVGSDKCKYSLNAEKLLKYHGIPYTKKFYSSVREALNHSGTNTIPAVYINEKYIGGYDDLESLIAAKEL